MSRDTEITAPSPPANQAPADRLNRILPVIASVWLILMTGWYVGTVARALARPLNQGDDLAWAWWWAWFVVSVVLAHLLVRRRLLTLICLAALTAVAIAMIALSHQIGTALVVAALLLSSWAWGDWILRQMEVGPSPSLSLDRATVALPLGLALMALVALSLCLAQRLTSRWTWLLFSAVTLVQWRSLRTIGPGLRRLVAALRPVRGEPMTESGIIAVLLGFVFLLDLSWALAPEIQYDALSAHLPVAKYYVEHTVVALSYGYVANLVDVLFALALSLQGQIAAKLLVLASSVLATLGVYTLGRRLFTARVGLWAAALFFSTPLVIWLSSTTYIDAVVTMLLLSSLLGFLRWREDRIRGWLWASGLLAGAALAAKLNSLLGLLGIALVLLWDLIRDRQPARERLKAFAGYAVGVVLVAAPTLALAYAFTGNPFYPVPLLQKVFDPAGERHISLVSNAHLFGIGTTPMALLRLPAAFTFETERFGEALPAGGVGLALALVPLALMSGVRVARRAAVLLMLLLVYVVCLAFTMQYARYYIPVLPVAATLAVSPLAHSFKKWLTGIDIAALGLVVCAQVALSPLMYWNIPERFPIKLALGRETQESFLGRSLHLYPAVRFLNSTIRRGDKVLAVGAPTVRIYVHAPLSGPFETEIQEIAARSTPTTLASNLLRSGFTYLLVNRAEWMSTLPLPYLTEPFLRQFTTLVYAGNNVGVYRLRMVAVDSAASSNLLANPGFEFLSEAKYPETWLPYGQPLIVQNPGQAHGGTVAVRAGRDDGLFTRLPIRAGSVYSLGYWCRADKPDQRARLQINWLDARLRIVGVSIDVVLADRGWAWKQFSATAPAGAGLAQVYVSVHEDGEVWFDDYFLAQGQLQKPQ